MVIDLEPLGKSLTLFFRTTNMNRSISTAQIPTKTGIEIKAIDQKLSSSGALADFQHNSRSKLNKCPRFRKSSDNISIRNSV